MCSRGLLAFAVLLSLSPVGRAQAPPETAERVADRVVAALEAGDAEALRGLAARDEPDPWIVAEELCLSGREAAARAFAAASPRAATRALPEYVAARPPDERSRTVYRQADQAATEGRSGDAMAILDGAEPDRTVCGVRQLHLRAILLMQAGRIPESVDAWRRASDRAEEIGWILRAGLTAAMGARLASQLRRHDAVVALSTRAAGHFDALGLATFAVVAYSDLGTAHLARGANARAISSFERALARLELVNDETARQAVTFGLAGAFFNSGDCASALRHCHAALAIAERLERWDDAVTIRQQTARCLAFIGRTDEAAACLRRTVDLAKARGLAAAEAEARRELGALLAEKDPAAARSELEAAAAALGEPGRERELARTLVALARVRRSLGDEEEALDLAARSRAAAESTSDPVLVHEVVLAEAEIRRRLGQTERAIALCRQALGILGPSGPPWARASTLSSLGSLLNESEDPNGALQAWQSMARLLRTEFAELTQEHAAAGMDTYTVMLREPIRVSAENGRAEDLFSFLETLRAAALVEALAGGRQVADRILPPQLLAEASAARDGVAAARQGVLAARSAGALTEIRRAKAELREAEVLLLAVAGKVHRERRVGADLIYPSIGTLPDLSGRLRDGEALVLFDMTGADAVALRVDRRDARIVRLGDSASLRSEVAALFPAGGDALPAEAVLKLRARLVGPLGLDAETTRILVSPQDVLAQVPFCLLTEREVAYVPSATCYSLLLDEPPSRGRRILALGDPAYGSARPAGEAFVPLPGSREEALAVGDEVLLGKEATVTRLREALASEGRWRAVHLACHGVIDPERPAFSALAVSPDAGSDGFLTCLDIFETRIRADLAVLSACDTAKGRIYRSEGIVGLMRAFMTAGAPRVLCSLWPVDDAATKALMVKFYEQWNPKEGAGLSAAGALRRAQDFVRSQEKWKDPEYWAAWVLWGRPD